MCIVEIHDRDIIFFPNFTIKKTMTRIKAKTFVFVKALKRAVWNVLTVGCFNFFLEFFFGGVSLIRPCCLPSYLRGFWINSLKAWGTSSSASCCYLNVSSMSRRSSRIQDSFCNGRPNGAYWNTNVSVADQPIAERTLWKEERFLLISFRFYSIETVHRGNWVYKLSI